MGSRARRRWTWRVLTRPSPHGRTAMGLRHAPNFFSARPVRAAGSPATGCAARVRSVVRPPWGWATAACGSSSDARIGAPPVSGAPASVQALSVRKVATGFQAAAPPKKNPRDPGPRGWKSTNGGGGDNWMHPNGAPKAHFRAALTQHASAMPDSAMLCMTWPCHAPRFDGQTGAAS